uniref:NADH-ubiquinone oxidoreductase chain 2 n=1 Tax=Microthoracius praelongiceps TaxID=1958934 RepID=A0A1S5XVR9_9NEOP|nr:NADH dehydrogenase subunit 2 [Microthoracius praelongiceps]
MYVIPLLSVMSTYSSSWWTSIMSMELNTIFFLPFLSKQKLNQPLFSMWVYFLFQALGSMLIYFSVVSTFVGGFEVSFFTTQQSCMLIMMGVMMKLGLSPFHSYFLHISEGLGWKEFWILNSIIKLPIILCSTSLLSNTPDPYIVLILIGSAVVMMISFMKENSLRRILVLSSGINMVWILIAGVIISTKFLLTMFMGYLLSLSGVVLLFMKSNFNKFEMLSSLNSKLSLKGKILFAVVFCTLMGMPPLYMFFFKLKVIFEVNNLLPPSLSLILILINAFMAYPYCLLMTNLIFMKSSSILLKSSNHIHWWIGVLVFTSIIGSLLLMA